VLEDATEIARVIKGPTSGNFGDRTRGVERITHVTAALLQAALLDPLRQSNSAGLKNVVQVTG
jgi:hypothetical protein